MSRNPDACFRVPLSWLDKELLKHRTVAALALRARALHQAGPGCVADRCFLVDNNSLSIPSLAKALDGQAPFV